MPQLYTVHVKSEVWDEDMIIFTGVDDVDFVDGYLILHFPDGNQHGVSNILEWYTSIEKTEDE